MQCTNGPHSRMGLTKDDYLCQRAIVTHVHNTPSEWGLLALKRMKCNSKTGKCVVFKAVHTCYRTNYNPIRSHRNFLNCKSDCVGTL